ncbi:MAG: GTP-dependent dephospho-CoA kinase family protein [Candidatus Methanofastidiosia archaeon]
MKLTPAVEAMLKRPLGILIQGEMPKTYELLKVSFGDALVIAVGDVVTEQLEKAGITPVLSIFDGKTKRKGLPAAQDLRSSADAVVPNPRSFVSEELWEAIKHCDFKNRKLFIDGEEDLATLPAILFAPVGAIVVYGQPDEGVVVVHVTDDKKDEIKSIISMMEGEKWK